MNKAGNPVVLVLTWAGRHRKHLVAGTLLRHTMFGVSNALAHKGAYGALFDVRCRILDRLARAPLGELDERSTGRIKTVLSDDVERLELLLAHNLPEAFMYVSGPVAALVFLLTANVPLALVTLVPAVIAFAVLARLFRTVKGIMPRATKSLEDMNTVMVEYITGMRVIKALDMGARSFTRFRAAVDEEYEVWGRDVAPHRPRVRRLRRRHRGGPAPHGPTGRPHADPRRHRRLDLPALRLRGVPLPDRDQAAAGLLQQALPGLGGRRARPGAPRAASLRVGRALPRGRLDPLRPRLLRVRRRRPPRVLRDVSLTVGAGERLAVVGPSGSGKSTLVQLVGRFYDATEGTVSIGGVDVRDIDYDDLLAHVSVVFQRAFLTSGTIADNIRMGSPAPLDDVRAAARLARADDFITALPQGYDTPIGTLGARLSGGERQRIAIARAILKDAPVLVLDEATSAADPENQALIDEAMDNLCEGRTVIVVAHRLDAVLRCDRIAVVQDGSLTRPGTHEDLLARSPYYRAAWDAYNQSRSMSYRIAAAPPAAAGAGEEQEALR